MPSWLDNLNPFAKRSVNDPTLTGPRRAAPTRTLGTIGTAMSYGYVQDRELNALLIGNNKYKTYSDLLCNTSIIAASVRTFVNVAAKAKWDFEAVEGGEEFADRISAMLMDDPLTPWSRIIRRAAMYRFYGFSVQEWTASRKMDGVISLKDVSPRAQSTIRKWDLNNSGEVRGIIQESPQDFTEIYLPRDKVMYLVDDTLADSPEGLGLFRHVVRAAKTLERFQQLEGYGYETDLNGIPVATAPLAEMANDPDLTEEQKQAMLAPVRSFMENHIRGPKTGLLLDSAPYSSQDESENPSGHKKWNIDLVRGGAYGQDAIARAITRVNHDIARVLGTEHLMVGEGQQGSFALSKDKSANFYFGVSSALSEIAQSVFNDLVTPIFRLNGWPMDMRPKPRFEEVQPRDVETITNALKSLAQSNLSPEDPATNQVRSMMGIQAAVNNMLNAAEEVDQESPDNLNDRINEAADQ